MSAELGLDKEILEANGIRMEETEHGIQHFDADGRVVFQTETHGETQQTIQFTYGEGEAMTEQGKNLTGPEEGKLLTREHPRTAARFEVQITDPDVEKINGLIDGRVETLAGTVGADGKLTERWANLEVTSPDFLEHFKSIPAERRKPNGRGEFYTIFTGEFGGGFDLELNGKVITVENIKKLSVTFSEAGDPIRANFGTISWKEKDAK